VFLFLQHFTFLANKKKISAKITVVENICYKNQSAANENNTDSKQHCNSLFLLFSFLVNT